MSDESEPSVAAAVQRDLDRLRERDEAAATSTTAMLALMLAREIDREDTPTSTRLACAREVAVMLERLQREAPAAPKGDEPKGGDRVASIAAQRAARRASAS